MRFLLLSLFLASLLKAQESEHTCRTLFLNGPQQAAGDYYLYDGKNSQKIELPRLSFSPVYKVRAGDVKLWLLAAPVQDPDKIPQGAPSVIVPAGTMDFYLLLSTDPTNQVLPLRIQVVNANQDHIGRGEMLWFNLTQKSLAGKVGTENLKLPPKTSALVKEPARANEDYPVELYFRVTDDPRTHPLIENKWRHDPLSRSIVFVFDEGKRRAPRVMSFTDYREAKDPEKEN